MGFRLPRKLKKYLKTKRASLIYPDAKLKDIRITGFNKQLGIFSHACIE